MSHHVTRFASAGWTFVLGLLALSTLPPAAPAAEPALRMKAFAVNMSGVGRARTENLEIVIERWSTDQEQKMILDTLVERSPEKLLDTVQKIKPRVGYIRTTTSLGWDIQYARQEDLPNGGKRVTFATDRPMGFYEVVNNTRSTDYEYIIGEVRLGPEGKGEGKLATPAKVRFDKDKRQIEIEDYGIEPVRLTQVTAENKTAEEK
jgi:hypothetical protein